MSGGGQGSPALGVALVGESLGEVEVARGLPFQGPAGLMLEQLLQRAGFRRDQFYITNTLWCKPPKPVQYVPYCTEHFLWPSMPSEVKVLVPLGEIALEAILGLAGIQDVRGYLFRREPFWVVPTLHPAFLLRGQQAWEGVVIRDLTFAVDVATKPPAPFQPVMYLDHPVSTVPPPPFAFDIETLGPKREDEGWTGGEIARIGIATAEAAISVPWTPTTADWARQVLAQPGLKFVWNRHFDVPALAAAHCPVAPPVWDAMEMWHLLQPDLRRALSVAASVLLPGCPYWKAWATTAPASYNAMDAAVTLALGLRLVDLLKQHRLWDLFLHDVVELDDLLDQLPGMPVDQAEIDRTRADLDLELAALQAQMDQLAGSARPRQLLKRPKPDTVPWCETCHGAVSLPHAHEVRYARFKAFKPSKQGLERLLGRPLDRVDRAALLKLQRQDPKNPLWPVLLRYRQISTLKGMLC